MDLFFHPSLISPWPEDLPLFSREDVIDPAIKTQKQTQTTSFGETKNGQSFTYICASLKKIITSHASSNVPEEVNKENSCMQKCNGCNIEFSSL